MIRTPPRNGHETDTPNNPQETGKNIDPNEFTVTEIKEILKGEGLSEKGKKVDLVQRLQNYATERMMRITTSSLDKYPHLVKPTTPPPPTKDDEDDAGDLSDNEEQVANNTHSPR